MYLPRWVSQVTLVVKNPPASRGDVTDVCSVPGSGRLPGERKATPYKARKCKSSCLENPMNRGTWWATDHGFAELDTTEVTEHTHYNSLYGKRSWQRRNICICITESLCYTSETTTTLWINYPPIKLRRKEKPQHFHPQEKFHLLILDHSPLSFSLQISAIFYFLLSPPTFLHQLSMLLLPLAPVSYAINRLNPP